MFAGTLSKISSGNDLDNIEVSAKFSLHPNVWNATFFLILVMISGAKAQWHNGAAAQRIDL